jgi:hypothetical protein
LVVKCAPLGASTTVSTIIRLISSCCGTTDFTSSSVGTTFSTDSSASRRHQEQVVEVRIDPGVGGVAALSPRFMCTNAASRFSAGMAISSSWPSSRA